MPDDLVSYFSSISAVDDTGSPIPATTFSSPIPTTSSTPSSSSRKRGRLSSEKSFNEFSKTHKHRIVENLLTQEGIGLEVVAGACGSLLRKEGKNDQRSILMKLPSVSPTKAKKARELFQKENVKKVTKVSVIEALNMVVDLNLSKNQYKGMRKVNINHGVKILPTWDSVRDEKKKCYPASTAITITDTKAQIKFQDLLDKSVERLVKGDDFHLGRLVAQGKVKVGESNSIKATLISKWGFDAATAQSTYAQSFTEPPPDDYCENSLLSTTWTPLSLSVNGITVWGCKAPSSTRYNRPIQLHYIKEAAEVSQAEYERCMSEISALQPSHATINIQLEDGTQTSLNIEVSHKLYCTAK